MLARGATVWDSYGWDLDLVFDLDGDEHEDVVVAAGFGKRYRVQVVSGRSGEELLRIGDARDSRRGLGAFVAVLNDDQVGAPKIVIGTPGPQRRLVGPMGMPLGPFEESLTRGMRGPGGASVWSARDGSARFEVVGFEREDRLGTDGCALGDVNGDGVEDFVLAGGGAECLAVVCSGDDGSVLTRVERGDVERLRTDRSSWVTLLLGGACCVLPIAALIGVLSLVRRHRRRATAADEAFWAREDL